MANEGIPVRAIARCTRLPSDEIRDHLDEAKRAGFLIEIPRDDWPPNTPRSLRVPMSQAAFEDELVLLNTVAVFKVTQQQALLLLMLVRWREATRGMLHSKIKNYRPNARPRDTETDQKIVDVQICKLRAKLKPLGIEIDTIWSCGYRLPPPSRAKALEMLNASLETKFKVQDNIENSQ
jgi:hypothetical protein